MSEIPKAFEWLKNRWHYFTQEEYLREDRFPALGGDLHNAAGSFDVHLHFEQLAVVAANGDNDNISIVGSSGSGAIPDTRSFLRITGPTAAFAITGFANGEGGHILMVYSTVSQTLTIKNEAAASAAANRILTLTGGDVVLRPNAPNIASFIYDGVGERWILMSTNWENY